MSPLSRTGMFSCRGGFDWVVPNFTRRSHKNYSRHDGVLFSAYFSLVCTDISVYLWSWNELCAPRPEEIVKLLTSHCLRYVDPYFYFYIVAHIFAHEISLQYDFFFADKVVIPGGFL